MRPKIEKILLILRQTGAALVLAVALRSAAGAAEPTPETLKLAAEVPIADVHLHLEAQFTPAELLARMNRNNVRWVGGVGPVTTASDFRAAFVDALGARYIPTLGEPEFTDIFFQKGALATEDANHPRFRALVERAESEFKAGWLKGFGELFPNNRTSNYNPLFRRKVRTDAPTFRELYALAAKYGGFLQIHMEDDNDSVAQLESLLAIEPRAAVILAHCGVSARPETIRRLMERHPNLYCEPSGRAPPVLRLATVKKGPPRWELWIFDERRADPAWLALIEALPDRFMIGTDAYNIDYDATLAVYRKGLLSRLTPVTLRKVAFENAQRVLRLQ